MISMTLTLRMVSEPTSERIRKISAGIINNLYLYTPSIIRQISEQVVTAIQTQQPEAQFSAVLQLRMIEKEERSQQLSTGASVAQPAVSGSECLSLTPIPVEQHAAMEAAESQGIDIPLTIEIPAEITLSGNNQLSMAMHGDQALLSEAIYGQIAPYYGLQQDQGASASQK